MSYEEEKSLIWILVKLWKFMKIIHISTHIYESKLVSL